MLNRINQLPPIFAQKEMLNDLLENSKRELINGTVKKRHPFRYFTLATSLHTKPFQRTVVLRKIDSDFNLVVFTDARSQKIYHIAHNDQVSALFYHPKKLLQIQLSGTIHTITDTTLLKDYWQTVSDNAKKDYTTTQAPGTPIKNPDLVNYEAVSPNFCVLHLVPNRIEILQLKRPNHLRASYTRQKDIWEGTFLVP